MRVLKSILAWFFILVLAMLNGIFREAVLLPAVDKPIAFLLSGLLLSSFVLLVAVALARRLAFDSPARCFSAGFLWFVLTLLFEFGFGWMQGQSWGKMLENYTFKDGNIWPVVLLVILLAPSIAARLRPPAN